MFVDSCSLVVDCRRALFVVLVFVRCSLFFVVVVCLCLVLLAVCLCLLSIVS